jgi:dihydrofolate reductase
VRKIVLFLSVSLDGFMAGPDGDLSWNRVNEEIHQHFNDVLKEMSCFIEGRVTYELMADFWPTADQDPESTPAMVEFAGIWRDLPKLVYSRTLTDAGWGSTVLREVVPDDVRALKEQPGGDICLGGADLARTFLEHDLVDELRLYVHPALVGAGRRSFETELRRDWELAESRTFSNGVVLVRYGRQGA